MCFHADTVKLLWEHNYRPFHGDVPPHRALWPHRWSTSATGNVFALSDRLVCR